MPQIITGNHILVGANPFTEPVILLRQEMASGEHAYQILVDNHASKENTTRYAEHQGYHVQVEEQDGEYTLTFTK